MKGKFESIDIWSPIHAGNGCNVVHLVINLHVVGKFYEITRCNSPLKWIVVSKRRQKCSIWFWHLMKTIDYERSGLSTPHCALDVGIAVMCFVFGHDSIAHYICTFDSRRWKRKTNRRTKEFGVVDKQIWHRSEIIAEDRNNLKVEKTRILIKSIRHTHHKTVMPSIGVSFIHSNLEQSSWKCIDKSISTIFILFALWGRTEWMSKGRFEQ